ncbi:MAG: cupin domain-containing protein [Moorea sp. SIO3G5]|nr:cupin domain-containing protein [Moorena sp. SIO3G5]
MKLSTHNQVPHLLKAKEIESMPETVIVHALNAKAVRHTKSLSDALGITRLGIHLVRVEPGKETTQFHFHHCQEEFIYIISGRGIAEIGNHQLKVGPGDFMGFTAPSLPHAMKNPFDQDLIYLMGGERREFDMCDYPRLKKRLYCIKDQRQLVNLLG